MERKTTESLPSHVPGAGKPAPSREGTREMPMPEVAPRVAGMPRDGRAVTTPGEPGVPAEEDDVLDTSGLEPPGKAD